MKKNIIKILVGAAIMAILVVLPVLVSALTFLEPLPGLAEKVQGQTVLSDYLAWLFRFALVTAAFLAVLKIVIGGLHIIVGGASEAARSKGREMIEMALWGLLLAISSVLILNTINPDLVKTGLTIPPIVIEKGEEKKFKRVEVEEGWAPCGQKGGVCMTLSDCSRDGYESIDFTTGCTSPTSLCCNFREGVGGGW